MEEQAGAQAGQVEGRLLVVSVIPSRLARWRRDRIGCLVWRILEIRGSVCVRC